MVLERRTPGVALDDEGKKMPGCLRRPAKAVIEMAGERTQ